MIYLKWQKLFERISLLQKLQTNNQDFLILSNFNDYILQNKKSQNVKKLLFTLTKYYHQIFQKLWKFFPDNLQIFQFFLNWVNIIKKQYDDKIYIDILIMLQTFLTAYQQKSSVNYFFIYGTISVKAATFLLDQKEYQKCLLVVTSFNQDFRAHYKRSLNFNNLIKKEKKLLIIFVRSFLIIILCLFKINKQKNFDTIVKIQKNCSNIIFSLLQENHITQDDKLFVLYKKIENQIKFKEKKQFKVSIINSIEQLVFSSLNNSQIKISQTAIQNLQNSYNKTTIKSNRSSQRFRIQKQNFENSQNFKETIVNNKLKKFSVNNQNNNILEKILQELEHAKQDRQKIMQDQKLILKSIEPLINKNQENGFQKILSNLKIQLYIDKPKLHETILFQCFSDQLIKDQQALTYIIPLKTSIEKYHLCFEVKQNKEQIFILISMKNDKNKQNFFSIKLQQLNAIFKYCNIKITSTLKDPISQIDTFIEFIVFILVYHLKIEREIIRNDQQKFFASLNIFPCFPYQTIVEDYIFSNSKVIETLIDKNTYKLTYLNPVDNSIQMQSFLIDEFDNFLGQENHSLNDTQIIDLKSLKNGCGKTINISHLYSYQEKKIEQIKQQYEGYFRLKADKIMYCLKIKKNYKNIVAMFFRNSKKNYEFFIFNEFKQKNQIRIYQSYFQKNKFQNEEYQVSKYSIDFIQNLFRIDFSCLYKSDKQFIYYLIYCCTQYDNCQTFLNEEKLQDSIKYQKEEINFLAKQQIDYFIIEGVNFILLTTAISLYKFKLKQKLYFYSVELSEEQKIFYKRNITNKIFIKKILSILFFEHQNELYPKCPSVFNFPKIRFVQLKRFTKLMQ